VINTTTTCALPRNKTPFEVWFGRKPRWITPGPMDYVDDEDLYDNESGVEDLVLTEIEA
jgi:hypothetical protein